MLLPAPNEHERDRPNRAERSLSESDVDWGLAREIALKTARRICNNRDTGTDFAEDIAQDSIIKLMANLSKVRVGWKPLLYKIVLSVAATKLKRESRQPTSPVDETLIDNESDGEPQPALGAQNAEDLEAFQGLLCELDQRFGRGTRAILELRCRGTRWQEIARITKLKDRTNRYRYEKAKKWMKDQWSRREAKG